MNNNTRMLCLLVICLISLAMQAQDAGDPADNSLGSALKEIQAARIAKNKAVKTADQLLAFLPPVVATCGEQPITASEIRDLLRQKLQIRLHAAGKLSEEDVKKMVLEQISQLVDDEVLRKLAAKAGLKPDLDAARRKIETDTEKNPVAETLFAAQGLSMAQAIQNQSMQQLREDWIKTAIVPKVAPSDAEIQLVYENQFAIAEKPEAREIFHILIKSEPNDAPDQKAAARKKCEEVLDKVKAGGDFSELAKKYSDCPSKSKGGSLGEQSDDGSLVKEFTAVAFKLDQGALSGIVETPFGYHIIKIGKITKAGRPSLERVRPEIIGKLSKEKAENLAQKTMEEARQTVSVKINL